MGRRISGKYGQRVQPESDTERIGMMPGVAVGRAGDFSEDINFGRRADSRKGGRD